MRKNLIAKSLITVLVLCVVFAHAAVKEVMELSGIALLTKKDAIVKKLGQPQREMTQDDKKYLMYTDKYENTLILQVGNYGFTDQITAVQYSGSNDSPQKLDGVALNTSRYRLVQIKGNPEYFRTDGEKYKLYFYGNYSYEVDDKDVVDSLRIELPNRITAEKLYALALENKVSEYDACVYVAQYYKDAQAFDVAKKYFEKAFTYKKEWQIQHNYANTLKEMGDYRKALDIYKEIQAKVTYNEIIEYNIGLSYYEMHQLSDAEKQLAQLTQHKDIQKPILFSALRMLGNINDDQKQPEKALQYYNQALALDATNAALLYDLGVFYKGQGEKGKAKEYFQRALQQNPDHYSAKKELESL